MPRANRHFLPGYVWHITHRCRDREFLLKFAKDRAAWISWLYEAKRRFEIEVLNYTVTSNHIHLLVRGGQNRDIVPNSMQLVAGRVAQEFNQRWRCSGPFWEDRYHATAVQTGSHLVRCMIYIDMNMVRAGVVDHPQHWKHGGYHEILSQRDRYRIISRDALLTSLGMADPAQLQREYSRWIAEALALKPNRACRETRWTEALAVGSEDFTREIQGKLKSEGWGHKKSISPSDKADGDFELREAENPYRHVFDLKKGPLRVEFNENLR